MEDHVGGDKFSIEKTQDFVRGNKHVTYIQHGERQIPKYLGTLPLLPEVFLGREKDLKAVHQTLHDEDNLLLLVNGEGGIGKTTLASRYYDRSRNDYQHLAWVFAGEDLLGSLLTIAPALELKFPPSMGREDRVQLLLVALQNLGGSNLLIIDNANDVEQLEASYLALQRLENFHVLLTSRINAFQKAAYHKILPLPREEAFALFREHYEKHDPKEDELLEAILEAVGYNTLVIELLAKNLGQHNDELEEEYPLAVLFEELVGKGLFGLSKTELVAISYQAKGSALRKEAPQDILAAMYELGDLPEAERKLLSIFSVLPAESIPYKTLKDLLPEFDGLKKTVRSLSQKGWIEFEKEEASFKISPVIQEVCRVKSESLFLDCETLIDRLNHKLKFDTGTYHLLHTSYEEAISLSRYAKEIISWVAEKEYALYLLSNKLGSYFTATGNLPFALRFYQKSLEICKKLLKADSDSLHFKDACAISYNYLGNAHGSMGDLEAALRCYEKYNELLEDLYKANPENTRFKHLLAISYSKLGQIHSYLGNQEEALRLYKEYNRLGQELYGIYPQQIPFIKSLAISYSRLGQIHRRLGNLEEALRFFDQYQQLGEQLYETYPQNVSLKNGLAISYEKLGQIHSDLGNFEEALRLFEQQSRLSQELYDAYPQNVSFKNGLTISYSKLGDIHRTLGNMDEALSFSKKDIRLSQELYDAYPQNVSFKNGLALSYQLLGVTLEKVGEKAKAKEGYEKSRLLLIELVETAPGYVKFQESLQWVENRLKEL